MSQRRAGVLGHPVAHSLSPVLHRAAYRALDLDWSYDAVECGVADLPTVLAARPDWAGFSATMPLKHALLDVAAEVRPRAAAAGAANTLLPGPNGWVADNTDVLGVLGALAEQDLRPTTTTIVGAGGTAQAVLVALRECGVGRCSVLVRDLSRTFALAATARRVGVEVDVEVLTIGAPALAAELVVSTLPPGAADPLAQVRWSPEQAVFDVVYVPWPTPLAAAVGRSGATVVSGASMLLHQASAQVELMTARSAPVAAMREALHAALGR